MTTFTLAQVRSLILQEFRSLASELEADFATKDPSDHVLYCSNCGGPRKGRVWHHDPDCIVPLLRRRKPRVAAPKP